VTLPYPPAQRSGAEPHSGFAPHSRTPKINSGGGSVISAKHGKSVSRIVRYAQ